jgi:hypothetical protein
MGNKNLSTPPWMNVYLPTRYMSLPLTHMDVMTPGNQFLGVLEAGRTHVEAINYWVMFAIPPG